MKTPTVTISRELADIVNSALNSEWPGSSAWQVQQLLARKIMKDALNAQPEQGERAEFANKLLFEAEAMHKAVAGEYIEGTFHALNWADKPHRVVYDACKLMKEAAALLQSSQPEPAGELPPLPEPVASVDLSNPVNGLHHARPALDYFRTHQMQDYARAAIAQETKRADAWVNAARDLARKLGLADDESSGSIQDWRFIERAAIAQSKLPDAIHVTEDMHTAAVKVLLRAHGLDGLPQRMMNAMLAAAPQAAQPKDQLQKLTEATEKHGLYEGDFAQPQASEPVFINGLTEAETDATMSVRGLSEPKAPEIDCRQCGHFGGVGEKLGEWRCAHNEPCTDGNNFVNLEPVKLYRRAGC